MLPAVLSSSAPPTVTTVTPPVSATTCFIAWIWPDVVRRVTFCPASMIFSLMMEPEPNSPSPVSSYPSSMTDPAASSAPLTRISPCCLNTMEPVSSFLPSLAVTSERTVKLPASMFFKATFPYTVWVTLASRLLPACAFTSTLPSIRVSFTGFPPSSVISFPSASVCTRSTPLAVNARKRFCSLSSTIASPLVTVTDAATRTPSSSWKTEPFSDVRRMAPPPS